MREKLVNGVRVRLTAAEEAARDAEEAEWARPPTQAEKDAERDERTNNFTANRQGKVLFAVAKAIDPTMNATRFRNIVKAAMK